MFSIPLCRLTPTVAFAIMPPPFGEKEKEVSFTMMIIERAKAHYEAQDVEFGRVYKWCPECVVVECECGKRSTHKGSDLIGSEIICECGEDRVVDLGEEVAG